MKRSLRVITLVAVFGLSLSFGRVAAGHTVNFHIWGYNVDLWAGAQNHYHNQWELQTVPWDYVLPIDAQVREEAAGSFYWQVLKTGPGTELNGLYSIKGSLWIWNQSGAQLWTSSAFECDPISYSGQLFPSPRVYNSMSQGAYEQWSGSGGSSSYTCYESYISKDYYGINAY